MNAQLCDKCGVPVVGAPPRTGTTNGSRFVLAFSFTLRAGVHLCRTCFVVEAAAVVAASNGRDI